MSDKPEKTAPGGNPLAMGPVEKLQLLHRASGVTSFTRVQLAMLIILTNRASSKDGIAWPSFIGLAAEAGTTPRHAKRAMKGLIQTGAVSIALPGTRTRSNRYRVNRAAFAENMPGGSDLQDTTGGSDVQDTTVVSPKALGGGVQVQDVVACMSPESINESSHKAKMKLIEMEGARAIAGGPGGPLRSAGQPGGDMYPEFWQAFGVRSTVSTAEKRLRELLAAGVDYAAVVDGANRYNLYCIATGGKKRSSADRWLEREGWRDSWTVPVREHPDTDKAPKEGIKRAVEAQSKPAKGKGGKEAKPPQPTKPDDDDDPENNPALIAAQDAFNDAYDLYEKHGFECPECMEKMQTAGKLGNRNALNMCRTREFLKSESDWRYEELRKIEKMLGVEDDF